MQFIAVDWGSSRFRAWRIEADGQISDTRESDQGLKSVTDGGSKPC